MNSFVEENKPEMKGNRNRSFPNFGETLISHFVWHIEDMREGGGGKSCLLWGKINQEIRKLSLVSWGVNFFIGPQLFFSFRYFVLVLSQRHPSVFFSNFFSLVSKMRTVTVSHFDCVKCGTRKISGTREGLKLTLFLPYGGWPASVFQDQSGQKWGKGMRYTLNETKGGTTFRPDKVHPRMAQFRSLRLFFPFQRGKKVKGKEKWDNMLSKKEWRPEFLFFPDLFSFSYFLSWGLVSKLNMKTRIKWNFSLPLAFFSRHPTKWKYGTFFMHCLGPF